MSLLSYEEVRPWAKSIRKKVTSREMPPWGPIRTSARQGRSQPERGADSHNRGRGSMRARRKGATADLPPVPAWPAAGRAESRTSSSKCGGLRDPRRRRSAGDDFFTRAPFTEDVYVKALECGRERPA